MFHDLVIGPVTPQEAAVWQEHPWIEVIGSPEPDWDCKFSRWCSEFSEAIPSLHFRVELADANTSYVLPRGMRVQSAGESWVVTDEKGLYWCGLIDNCWTETPDDNMPALTYATEADAKAAFVQADRMYSERSKRHFATLARIDSLE